MTGVTPDGTAITIRLPMFPLTIERRLTYAKAVIADTALICYRQLLAFDDGPSLSPSSP
jgi:hypothetical protein